jgi:Ca2+-binding EF-hand superfamily protein
VEAKVRGWTKYYEGTILKVHSEGTYDIRFKDGERKREVPEKSIRSIDGDESGNGSGSDRSQDSHGDKDSKRKKSKSKAESSLEDDCWEDLIQLSKLIAKRNDTRWNRVDLDEVLEQRTDEDKLDILFKSKWLRGTRRHFEKEIKRGSKVSVDSIEDIFENIGTRASKSDLRRWRKDRKLRADDTIDFATFLHAYAVVFDDSEENSDRKSTISLDNREDPKQWRQERWAQDLGSGIIRAIEDAFDRHSVSRGSLAERRSSTRVLPVRRLRAALWDMDRDVSRGQIKEYTEDCGLRPEDNLTLAEFARCYYYLFADADRDGKGSTSYHDKLFNRKSLSSTMNTIDEPLTISETAQLVFANGWTGKPQEYDILMRRLCVGRSDAEVAALDLARQVFQDLDRDEDAEIVTADLVQLFRTLKTKSVLVPGKENSENNRRSSQSKGNADAGSKRNVEDTKREIVSLQPIKFTFTDGVIGTTVKRYTEKTGRGPRDKITFPEVLVEFGFVFESVTSKSTVASAFSQMRLHASLPDVRSAGDFVVGAINKVLENPYDSKYWRLREMSDRFHANLGRFLGGSELIQAVGFFKDRDAGSSDVFYQLRWPKGKAPIAGSSGGKLQIEAATKLLRARRAEVEHELKQMNGGRCSLADAIQSLYSKEPGWEEVGDAMKLALQYVTNILSHPDDARRWRVRKVNPIFERRIGRYGNDAASKLMGAIGFDESDISPEVYVLEGTETNKSKGPRFRFPTLDAGIASFLWRRKTELDIAIASVMEGKGHVFVTVNSKRKEKKAKDSAAGDAKPSKNEKRHKKHQNKTEKENDGHPVSAAEQQSVLSKYVGGKTAAQRAQLEMIKQAFDRFDLNRDGKVTAGELRVVFRQAGQDSSDRAIAKWIKDRDISLDGTVTFPEFVASFGALMQPKTDADDFLQRDPRSGEYVLNASASFAAALQKEQSLKNGSSIMGEETKADGVDNKINHSSRAVAAAVGLLKIFNVPAVVLQVCEEALGYAKRLSKNHTNQKLWQIDVSETMFDSKIGKYRGGLELLAALGYESASATSRFLTLRGSVGASKSGLSKSVLTSVRRSIMELTQHTNGLEFLEISNVHAASAAMSYLGSQSLGKNSALPTANQWRQLMETVCGYADAILRNPNNQSARRLNPNSKSYKTKINPIPGGVDIIVALGFREDATGGMMLPSDGNINEFRARSIEMKAAVAEITKFAA